MFFIDERGRGSWTVREMPANPQHRDYKFASVYATREEAEYAMLTDCYEWPEDLARFAVSAGCLVYDEAKRLFEAGREDER